MSDPVAGVGEMKRVTRPGGAVATCVWDHGGGQGPLSPFWTAVHELEPGHAGEAELMGSRQGQLAELFEHVGFDDIEETALASSVTHTTFEEWWEPFTFGVGPAGAYVAGLDDAERERTREACHRLLGDSPAVTARAWTVRATVPG